MRRHPGHHSYVKVVCTGLIEKNPCTYWYVRVVMCILIVFLSFSVAGVRSPDSWYIAEDRC